MEPAQKQESSSIPLNNSFTHNGRILTVKAWNGGRNSSGIVHGSGTLVDSEGHVRVCTVINGMVCGYYMGVNMEGNTWAAMCNREGRLQGPHIWFSKTGHISVFIYNNGVCTNGDTVYSTDPLLISAMAAWKAGMKAQGFVETQSMQWKFIGPQPSIFSSNKSTVTSLAEVADADETSSPTTLSKMEVDTAAIDSPPPLVPLETNTTAGAYAEASSTTSNSGSLPADDTSGLALLAVVAEEEASDQTLSLYTRLSSVDKKVSHEKTAMQKLHHKRAEEVAKVVSRFQPAIGRVRARLDHFRNQQAALHTYKESWLKSSSSRTAHFFSTDDIKLALYVHDITFSPECIDTNNMNGPRFAMVRNEMIAQQMLGIRIAGDCTRAVKVARSIASSNGVPSVADIAVAGKMEEPCTWSLKQFYEWAAVGPLKEIAAALNEHRIAGDIIMDMDIALTALLVGMDMEQEYAFEVAMKGLREKIKIENDNSAQKAGNFLRAI